MLWYFIVFYFVIHVCEETSVRGQVSDVTNYDCDSEIYCKGELLKTMQLAELFNDSKTFVDLYQLNDPEVTLSNFAQLMQDTNNNPSRAQLEVFLNENFSQESELDNWDPTDWQEDPPALRRIQDTKFRKWAKDLNAVWKTLLKKIKPEVFKHPKRHSILPICNPFIIPGGRFKEFYYWDSYWAIKGMLLCGMRETVRGILENFYEVVREHGFLPNGGRVYYLMRSQPPFLIKMTNEYMKFTNDIDFLEANIAALDREFTFWLETKMIEVEKDGKKYQLARYVVRSPRPRPESFREDYKVGLQVRSDLRGKLYNDLKTAAESGWDFSFRWVENPNDPGFNLSTIRTSKIIPVELNALLEENARTLSKFYLLLNNVERSSYYTTIAQHFRDGIDNVLWNKEEQVWLDYDTVENVSRKQFYPTNLSPLYTMSYDRSKAKELAESSVLYLKKYGITDYFGGTPASITNTREQWDFPNAWAPLQSFLILGLRGTGHEPAISIAKILAGRWLRANYIGFVEYGQMFEKYDAVHPGQYGGGGEYTVQAGFAFTNGVVFELLDIYSGTVFSDDDDDDESATGTDEGER